MRLFQWVSDLFSSRSPKWRKVEDEFLTENPACIVCGNTTRSQLTAHHRIPYHVDPSRELDKANLRTMCRDNYGFRCHLIFGHCGDYRIFCEDVDSISASWKAEREKAKRRYHQYGHL